MNYSKLLKTAIDYREMAYCPYSNFKVGAAVLFSSGKVYGGCNIENASYGATNCAERTAIYKGISEGERKIEAVAIIGEINNYTYPCGICCQVIAEFASNDTLIILGKNEDDFIVKRLENIFPNSFSLLK